MDLKYLKIVLFSVRNREGEALCFPQRGENTKGVIKHD